MTTLTRRPTNLVLTGIVGSTAYGMATPDSDIDRVGIYIEDTAALLGLDHQPETWEAGQEEPDEVLHEVAKFCRLAMKVNPTVSELLWLPERCYEVRTAIGEQLIEMRSSFLSANYARGSYLSYARGQFDKLERRGDGAFSSDLRHRTSKHARHIARLVHQGFTLWSTGTLQVEMVDPEPQWYVDFGEQVAEGDTTPAKQLLADFERKFEQTPTVLPEHPDRDAVDAWLKMTRIGQLG